MCMFGVGGIRFGKARGVNRMYILKAVETVGMIFVMIVVVCVCCKTGILDPKKHQGVAAVLVSYVGLPASVIYHLFDQGLPEKTVVIIIIACVVQYAVYALAMLAAKVLKVDKLRRGAFCALCAIPNAVFVGIPLATGIFGESAAMPVAMVVFAPNTLAMWTAGVFGLRRDSGKAGKFLSVDTLKHLSTPPLVSLVIGFILLALHVPMPAVLLRAAGYFANLCTPLSIVFVGLILYESGVKAVKILDRSTAGVMVLRFVITPVLAYAAARLIGLADVETMVFTLLLSMPSAMQIAVSSGLEGADSEYATSNVIFTTLASLLITPALVFAMMRFQQAIGL